ncbi:unnamed protein product [Bursaphelenchus okinawaensis]|uniref:Degenerin mec-4/10 cytosolic domain-containing protein n=1 Tax=Bursaphelenchus okinawaensis TaxID=465554 RepID=A0A811KL28_9BILA|nr:unnamed protein product [Bursaphelenchus okinawaensis]CAG9105436.1 unnamed protein product [Bursaphelenchus okinawaensis]
MSWIRSLKHNELLRDRDEYMKNVYGDPLSYWKQAEQTKFVTEREYWDDFRYGQCFDSVDSAVQCEIIHGEFDPKQLPYEKYMQWHFREFCYKTTAHGIPMIGQAPNRYYRGIWIALFLGCMFMLYQNARSVIDKYNKNEKIVDIELKFDTAPFPAITICNLNPYKASMAKDVELIKRTLTAFDGAMNKAGHSEGNKREKRASHNSSSVFEPGYSKCQCTGLETSAETGDIVSAEKGECEGEKYKWEKPDGSEDKCICAFDRATNDAWPCYLSHKWSQEVCESCDERNFCLKSLLDTNSTDGEACICAPSGEFCMAYDGIAEILQIWKYLNGDPEEEAQFIEAMGFKDMKDEVAIVTKAKENIIFAMSTLSVKERMLLSNSKRELLHKCSFNGQPCDIDSDFITRIDPIFGACFTYNHNRKTNLTSVRAGPMYGLRMLVYVNSSDYMPTTEATGVRLTIHDKDQFPFPDTFGFSAPTGFVSSFGLRLRRMSRLPSPYGDCVMDAAAESSTTYIYEDYSYSVEGCYRSCFQQRMLDECGCGDPRFPVPQGKKHCRAADSFARKCLEAKLQEMGGHQGNSSMACHCAQPCRQSIYSVTYSPARWPSKSLQIQIGVCNDTPTECTKHYKDNGAMLEVFYEQLNFEMLTESVAYGLVNLLADFGGQLGLWCGISFLTCCEFVFLLFETMYMSFQHQMLLHRQRKEEKEKERILY